MSEQQEKYVTDALEMTGAGYDQPAAIIDPPRMVKALRDGGLVEYQAWGWVKISAKFASHLRFMKGAKLSVWHCIASHIDESGTCKMTIKGICEITDYSHTEVISSLKELAEGGYLSIDRQGKTNIYAPAFAARGNGNDPKETLVKKLDSTPAYQYESSPAIQKSAPSIKRVKRVNAKAKKIIPIEVSIFRDVTSRYPNKANYSDVCNILKSVSDRLGRDVCADDLMPYFSAWTARGFNPANINWTSWAVTGIIPKQANQSTTADNRPSLETL